MRAGGEKGEEAVRLAKAVTSTTGGLPGARADAALQLAKVLRWSRVARRACRGGVALPLVEALADAGASGDRKTVRALSRAISFLMRDGELKSELFEAGFFDVCRRLLEKKTSLACSDMLAGIWTLSLDYGDAAAPIVPLLIDIVINAVSASTSTSGNQERHDTDRDDRENGDLLFQAMGALWSASTADNAAAIAHAPRVAGTGDDDDNDGDATDNAAWKRLAATCVQILHQESASEKLLLSTLGVLTFIADFPDPKKALEEEHVRSLSSLLSEMIQQQQDGAVGYERLGPLAEKILQKLVILE